MGNGRPPVNLGGVPIIGEGPPVEPVPRALLLLDDARKLVETGPGSINLPPCAGAAAGARVIGDAGEILLWRAVLVMIDRQMSAHVELVARLEAAGVLAPRPVDPSAQ